MEDQTKIHPYLLAGIAASITFLSIAFRIEWLAFFGLAPLFALSDIPRGEKPWRRIGLIASVLIFIFLTRAHYYSYAIPYAVSLAMIVAGCFLFNVFAQQTLGDRTGKIIIVLLWLAAEYVALKFHLAENLVFVADLGFSSPEWTSWTLQTGYLGISLWILSANLLFYHAFLKKRFSIGFSIAFLVIAIAPMMISSFSFRYSTLTKVDMIFLYDEVSGEIVNDRISRYHQVGEWIARTAAWVSALVVLYVAVKSKTKKK